MEAMSTQRVVAVAAVTAMTMVSIGGYCIYSLIQDKLEQHHKSVLKSIQPKKRTVRPKLVILVRHGESEGNCDHTLYRTKPDNQIGLTEKGIEQSVAAGKRIKKIVGDRKVTFIISPFDRTFQTFQNIMKAGFNAKQYSFDPRIREQEFGNLQDSDHGLLREQQKTVGRFYYRFPTGESGADVYDRAHQFWESLMRMKSTNDDEPAEVVIIVTHGLTMRLLLMQLFHWTPHTFHTVWNADNCNLYCLSKCDKAQSGYVFDHNHGDYLKSSSLMEVTFVNGEKKQLCLQEYLSIPAPREENIESICQMLHEQHPSDVIDPQQIKSIISISPSSQRFQRMAEFTKQVPIEAEISRQTSAHDTNW